MYGYWIVWALKSGPPNYILATILELDPDGVKPQGLASGTGFRIWFLWVSFVRSVRWSDPDWSRSAGSLVAGSFDGSSECCPILSSSGVLYPCRSGGDRGAAVGLADKADKVGQVGRAGTRRAVTQALVRGRPMVAVGEATAVVVVGFVAAAVVVAAARFRPEPALLIWKGMGCGRRTLSRRSLKRVNRFPSSLATASWRCTPTDTGSCGALKPTTSASGPIRSSPPR
jgi:hypothetical protein